MTVFQRVMVLLVGVAAGVGCYTFVYAKGGSYLTSDPRACMNCHIMNEHYDAWIKSSHRSVAVSNDCHTPCADLRRARDLGKPDAGLAPARALQRQAQCILGESIDAARRGQLALRPR